MPMHEDIGDGIEWQTQERIGEPKSASCLDHIIISHQGVQKYV